MLHHYAAKERILFELAINATTFFAFPPIINILGACESGRSASTFRLASVRTPAGSPSGCRSVKCQMKRPTVPFLAPKYSSVDSEALLGRFAKYTLTENGLFRLHEDGGNGSTVSFDCS